jgi:hypothetical protein
MNFKALESTKKRIWHASKESINKAMRSIALLQLEIHISPWIKGCEELDEHFEARL